MMSDDPDVSRQFDEKAISAILKRAAELQGESEFVPKIGLSLDELQRVGREAGIDPAFVLRAASEHVHFSPESEKSLFGSRPAVSLIAYVDRDIDADAWNEMLSVLRKWSGDVGTTRTDGEAREWVKGGGSTDSLTVSLAPRTTGTQIQAFWSNPGMAIATYTVALVLAVIMLPVVFESMGLVSIWGVLLHLGIIATLFLTSRQILNRGVRKKKQKLQEMMAQLETIAVMANQEGQPRSAPSLENVSVEMHIDSEEEGEVQKLPTPRSRRAR